MINEFKANKSSKSSFYFHPRPPLMITKNAMMMSGMSATIAIATKKDRLTRDFSIISEMTATTKTPKAMTKMTPLSKVARYSFVSQIMNKTTVSTSNAIQI